jgi:hypothetical protein
LGAEHFSDVLLDTLCLLVEIRELPAEEMFLRLLCRERVLVIPKRGL